MAPTAWTFAIYLLMPVPALFFVLMSIPYPMKIRGSIRRTILKAFDKLFAINLGLPLIILLTGVALLLWLYCVAETWQLAVRQEAAMDYLEKDAIRRRRWRAERNFWIASFELLLWLAAAKIRELAHEMEELKRRVREERRE